MPPYFSVTDDDYHQEFPVPLKGAETHGGEDVSILASGPMSHLVTGVHQQNFIAYLFRYVSSSVQQKLDSLEAEPQSYFRSLGYSIF